MSQMTGPSRRESPAQGWSCSKIYLWHQVNC